MLFSLYFQSVTGMDSIWFQVLFDTQVCFMIEFDTHDILCLVSSIVLILRRVI